ncbi:MAG TPA: hypothetical protein VM513_13630 [Kofleriaceae bacterium]|jgi:hypothetical protein|nr:hypothetical protein [Kofleriaceae bacterium]
MSAEDVTCEAIEAAVIDGRSITAYADHIAGCPACQGLITITHQIHDTVAVTPHTAGQKPQWLAELHARRARRRKVLAWTAGGLAAAAGVTALLVIQPWSSPTMIAEVAEDHPLPLQEPTVPAQEARPATAPRDTPPSPPPGVGRPAWVTSDTPFTGYCIGERAEALRASDVGISCVGTSSYRFTKDDGRSEARDVALEAVSLRVAERIETQFFTEKVRPAYEPAFRALHDAYDKANDDREAYRRLADARHRAAIALTRDAGASLPLREADWYWEEYPATDGKGTEFMVWVRYDLGADQIGQLIQAYEAARVRDNQHVVSAFPLLAFPFDGFRGGDLPADGPVTREAVLPAAPIR